MSSLRIRKLQAREQASPSYAVTETAISMARSIGVGGDVAKRLVRMARRSAPLTHPAGNRRFDAFVLQVQDRVVVAIDRY